MRSPNMYFSVLKLKFPVLKLNLVYGFYRITNTERGLLKFYNKLDVPAIFRLLFHILWLSYNIWDLDFLTNGRINRQTNMASSTQLWLLFIWSLSLYLGLTRLLPNGKYIHICIYSYIIDWQKDKIPFYQMISGYTFIFHSLGKSKFEYTSIPSVQNIKCTTL